MAHYTGSGINDILDLTTDEYHEYLDAAIQLYESEMKAPRRVVLAGIEKR